MVLGDDDAHGTTILTVVGPPAGLSTSIEPSNARSRWATPASPPPSAEVGTAAAVVADLDPQVRPVVHERDA